MAARAADLARGDMRSGSACRLGRCSRTLGFAWGSGLAAPHAQVLSLPAGAAGDRAAADAVARSDAKFKPDELFTHETRIYEVTDVKLDTATFTRSCSLTSRNKQSE
jgi:hypothetical protein